MAISAIRALFGRFFDTAFGYAVGGAAQSAIDPLVNPLAEEAWVQAVGAGDSRALNPADLANMAVQGVIDEATGAAEAARSGMSAESFRRLFRVNGAPIAPDQALDLWNRGLIAEADVDRALLQSRLKPEWVDTFKLLRRQILQLADLAEMVVQGVLPTDEATQRAAHLGVAADDFGRLIRLAGNPPGPQEMLTLWNRGEISEADVDRGLLQSRLKPEWVDTFKQLRRRPASLADAVNAVLKERIPLERGVAIAAENGVDAETFAMLVDEAGRPVGIGQALTLVRRGQMTDAEFHEVVARSDVKTQYAAQLLELRTVYPSLYQLKQMLAAGAINDAEALDVLAKEGYPLNLAHGVVAAGHGTKLAGSRQLTQAAIVDAYRTQQLERADATQLLEGLGYDQNDAGLLLAYADYQRTKSYRDAVIAVVRARYLQSDIDRGTASNLLDTAGLPPAERDQYLELWTFDVQANPRLLTLAELNLAVKHHVITPADYEAYLPRLNFQQPEIGILVALYASPAAAAR